MGHLLKDIIILILVLDIEHFLHWRILVASLMEILCSCPKLLASALSTRVWNFNSGGRSSLAGLWNLLLGSRLVFVPIDWRKGQITLFSGVWLTLSGGKHFPMLVSLNSFC